VQECQNLRLFVEFVQYLIILVFSKITLFFEGFIPIVTLEITLVTVTENKCQFKCMAEVIGIKYQNK
jgi:hypothetical protein